MKFCHVHSNTTPAIWNHNFPQLQNNSTLTLGHSNNPWVYVFNRRGHFAKKKINDAFVKIKFEPQRQFAANNVRTRLLARLPCVDRLFFPSPVLLIDLCEIMDVAIRARSGSSSKSHLRSPFVGIIHGCPRHLSFGVHRPRRCSTTRMCPFIV